MRLVFLFLILSVTVHAQSVTGKWRGHLTQEPGVLYGDYYYEMELVQTGNSVTGTARIFAEENFAVMPLTGTFDGKKFTFKESRMEDSKIRFGYSWCIKSGTLAFSEKNKQYHLEGPWTGYSSAGNCNPGNVYLMRVPEKSQPKDSVKTIVTKDSTDNSSIVLKNGKVEKVYDRLPKSGRVLTVKKGATIKIRLSDNAKSDGDSISLYYNDKALLEHYPLVKNAKTIELKLDPNADVHALILFAENLGSIPPNTAMVEIDDGENKQNMSMESDLDRCDVLYLKER